MEQTQVFPTPKASLGDTVVFKNYSGDIAQGVIIRAEFKTIRASDPLTPAIKSWVYQIEQTTTTDQKSVTENVSESDVLQVLHDKIVTINQNDADVSAE